MLATFAALALVSAPRDVEVTAYNQGFGVVKEVRSFSLTSGVQRVSVPNVASQIDPTSVRLRSLTDPKGLSVLEQNYQFDLITPLAILQKCIGKTVRYTKDNRTVEATLLSAPTAAVPAGNGQMSYPGMVLQFGAEIILDPVGTISVPSIPEGLISQPTLVWDLQTSRDGTQDVELSYITQGMRWSTDYVLTMEGNTASLQGWVTLTNDSGTAFSNARLKLLAGSVNTAPERAEAMNLMRKDGFPAGAPEGVTSEGLFEYYLYTVQRPTTIANRETKQISLLESASVPLTRELVLAFPNFMADRMEDVAPQARLLFANNAAAGLGIPLPAGRFRIYQRDKSGSVQLLGEDRIDHTPKEDRVNLTVGSAFDVRGNRVVTNRTRLGGNSYRYTVEIEVRNRKDTAERVLVNESLPPNSTLSGKSEEPKLLDASTAQFTVNLKANETRRITFTVTARE